MPTEVTSADGSGSPPAVISLGILAWNEAASIRETINSILAQSLVQTPPDWLKAFEVICVPNGCTDDTAAVARKALEAGLNQTGERVTGRVHEVAEPSKANAWNVFVHEASADDATALVLMDGDVILDHPDALLNLAQTLQSHPEAKVAGATPIKHLARRRGFNPLHRLSLGASTIRRAMPGTFAGCCYMGRAEALRAFRLPSVLIGEDVFVRAMIVTDFFTRPDDTRRVVRADDASVLFEAYTAPGKVFRNLVRRSVTLAIDSILFAAFWEHADNREHAGNLTHR
ncbi:MAG: glycosyltransferase, partial [Phycisphaeraceae bacterium]|nr:glycosyltransferase [Phycisphaeraceae bacterium]